MINLACSGFTCCLCLTWCLLMFHVASVDVCNMCVGKSCRHDFCQLHDMVSFAIMMHLIHCVGASCPPFRSVPTLQGKHDALAGYWSGLHSCIMMTKGHDPLKGSSCPHVPVWVPCLLSLSLCTLLLHVSASSCFTFQFLTHNLVLVLSNLQFIWSRVQVLGTLFLSEAKWQDGQNQNTFSYFYLIIYNNFLRIPTFCF